MMGNAKEWVPVAIMSGVKSVNPEEQREGNAFGVSRPPLTSGSERDSSEHSLESPGLR